MQGTLALTTVEQLQALAHPLRQRVLRLLGGEPRTNKQLASRLDTSPGKLHFHVRELEKAGLIALVEERPKGGIIEKYYQATAQNYTLDLPIGDRTMIDGTLTTATLEAARQEYARAVAYFRQPPTVTTLSHAEARLTDEQVTRIKALLAAISNEMEADVDPDDPDARPYIFTALFHTMADPNSGH